MTRLSMLLTAAVLLSACSVDDAPPGEADGSDGSDLRRVKQSRRTDSTPTTTVPSTDPGATQPVGTQIAAGGLYTSANKIYVADGAGGGQLFKGRGANIHDTRSCWACAYEAPNVGEVTRRIDVLVDEWHANFIRVDMESYTDDASQQYGVSITGDAGYLADIEAIVRHATAKGVYVELSMWHDPSFDGSGWPTSATALKWATIAERFVDEPRVMFGISNEPTMNYDGAQDAAVWSAMNETLSAIRAVEDARQVPHHIVVAQGTGGWSRFVQYYTTNPLPGGNVAYEVHAYNPQSDFATLVTGPANTIPVIIGEFGPVDGTMTLADAAALVDLAMQLNIPYLAWTFHHRCPPNLLVDDSNGTCGVGMALTPTTYGQMLKDKLALAW
jgi:hypothetical protein